MNGNSIHKIRHKVRKKIFFPNYKWERFFLGRGWLRQFYFLSRQKSINIMVESDSMSGF